MAKRSAPEVNAGSMADIAFLLLIFFLVTTTIEKDSGISRKLPPIDNEEIEPPVIKQRNLFTVVISRDDLLLVEEDLMELSDLREAAIAYLDNGGGTGEEACDYCQGERNKSSSDNPEKAIITLQNDRFTSYNAYIAVQNELVAAYNFLRDREAQRLFGREFKEMEKTFRDVKSKEFKSNKLKEKIEKIKTMYPQKLSEAEPKKN